MWPFRKKKLIATKCGHETELKGSIAREVDGIPFQTVLTMPKNEQGSTDWCLECCAKMTVRCAWCGQPIMIGDPVTLYSPAHPREFQVPEYAVIYSEKPLRLVGCPRPSCADTGADYAGVWVPGDDGKGRVNFHGTIIGKMLGAEPISHKYDEAPAV